MVDVTRLDQFLEVIGDVGALVMATALQLAGGQFGIRHVVDEQCLHRVDAGFAMALEIILDDLEQAAVEPLDEAERVEVAELHPAQSRIRDGRCGWLLFGWHDDTITLAAGPASWTGRSPLQPRG